MRKTRKQSGKGLVGMLSSLLGGRRYAVKPKAKRRTRLRGKGFGSFLADLGSGLGSGVGNLIRGGLGSLFGGRRRVRKAPVKVRRARMKGRGDESGLSLSNINKALKESKAISNLLSNPALGSYANLAGRISDTVGYGKKRRMRGRGVNYLQSGPAIRMPDSFATTLTSGSGSLQF